MVEVIFLKRKEAAMEKQPSRTWKDFYLHDFFSCEKGNQNNMASLTEGSIPLVSARKIDNGYKDFVSPNNKKLFPGHILTLNNDGDGGAGIAYYQPHVMALDSHVTALVPKLPLSRYQLLFVAMCITKQRNRFGHGYSINTNRLRSFRIMLPCVEATETPDWQYMDIYMKDKEQELLKPTIEQLCKRLINSAIGGLNYDRLIGRLLILQKSLLRYKGASVSKKPTIRLAMYPMCHQPLSTMALMDLSEMKAA